MGRVALVAADPQVAEQIEQVLVERGDQVTRFSSGAVALLRIREASHEFVIADAHAPGLDGISLCRALREHTGKERLPILLLVEEESSDEILHALEADANDCLLKPFSGRELRAKIASCLRAREEAPPATKVALREDLQNLPATYGEYVLEEILGRGGFGAVFRARRRDGSVVALKMLHPFVNDDRGALARFFREVALLSRLDCPHIVQVVDTGFEEGRFYLAMSFLPGRSAEQMLQEEGPLPIPVVARIGYETLLALRAMHSRGIVHRDVKPANILIDATGHVTLVDLGMAKEIRDEGVTASTEIVGTISFLAPEVVRGGRQEASSDLYSLGVCLYQLLTGVLPFRGPSPIGILSKIVSPEGARPITSYRPEVPAAISDLVGRLLDHDPQVRQEGTVGSVLQPWIAEA